MSRSAEVMLDFAGEPRLFRLSIGPVRRVQEKCDAGPLELLSRYIDRTWRIDDVREVILQGLIGGGMAQVAAQSLIEKWFDPEPKQQFVGVAQAAMMAMLVGAEDESLGEPSGEDKTTDSPDQRSGSSGSTEPEEQ